MTRTYESPRRQEAARLRRERVARAAARLFVEKGYQRTKIEDIAAAASVSPQMIYKTFGNKVALLQAAIAVSVLGPDGRFPTLPSVAAAIEDPDPRSRIARVAAAACEALGRLAPLQKVVSVAADLEPEIAALWRSNREKRRADVSVVIKRCSDRRLSPAQARRIGDEIYALGSAEVYNQLIGDLGWSTERYERWLADKMSELILGPAT